VPRSCSSRLTARLAFVVASLLALGITACGGGEDVAQDRFASDLRERTTIPKGVAECLTDKVYEEFDQTEINRIYQAATEDELEDATRETLDGFNRTCFEAAAEGQGEGSSTTEGSSEEVPTSTSSEAPSTTAPGG